MGVRMHICVLMVIELDSFPFEADRAYILRPNAKMLTYQHIPKLGQHEDA